jgi:hypothetical protein
LSCAGRGQSWRDMGGRSSSSICQISVGVGEAGTDVGEALPVGAGVPEGWAVAVLVGVESTAREAVATGVGLTDCASGRAEGRLQASKKHSNNRAASTIVREFDITILTGFYGWKYLHSSIGAEEAQTAGVHW